MSASNLLQ